MRRRLERDLHDGAQQRLVSLALELRLAQDTVPAGAIDVTSLAGHGTMIEVSFPIELTDDG
jgi:signal transduction histidine kinase